MMNLKMTALTAIQCALMATLFFCSCNNKESNGGYSGGSVSESTYEDAKMTVAQQEAANPVQFLDANGEYRPALLGGNFKITGNITSKATEVTYKDVVVEFTYYSKTNSVVGSEQKVFYEYIKPNGRFDFEFKINAPSATNTIEWHVVDAKAN